jgi:predicted peptidase
MAAFSVVPGRQVARVLEPIRADEPRLPFLIHVPATGPSGERFPALLFLHGAGERGDGDLSVLERHGPPKLVRGRADFPFVVVSPQCPSGRWWVEEPLLRVLSRLLDEIVGSEDVDPDRVSLTGISAGGFGCWRLAAREAERLACIVPICGGGRRLDVRRLTRLAIWAFHGADDEIVPPHHSIEMIAALRAAGAAPRLTLYPATGHDSWTRTYDDPAVWEWIRAQVRAR